MVAVVTGRSSREAVRHRVVAGRLARAGSVAAGEEAVELLAAATDDTHLERLVARRVAGEPLAWVTGHVTFAGHRVTVHPGVYVPRWQSEELARRAAALLPEQGTAADLCTGAGAVALVVQRSRPRARVVGTEIDPVACRCATANGIHVRCGDLADPLLPALHGRCDVVTAVPPYVPTGELAHLPRDARDHEPTGALDGGPDGTRLLAAVARVAPRLLRPAGTLLLELGGDQDELLVPVLDAAGLTVRRRLRDADGDLRGIEVGRVAA